MLSIRAGLYSGEDTMQTERMPLEVPDPANKPGITASLGKDGDFSILDSPRAGSARPIFGLSIEQLSELCGNIDTQPYRAKQLAEALYRGWIGALSELTTWPKALRERLAAEGYIVGLPEIVQAFRSTDGTERYLIAGNDANTVETVWMPEGDDGEAGDGSEAGVEESATGASERHRATICVSSQVGCAVNCQFCLTAKLGIQRNLSAGEMAGQVIAVLKRQGVRIGRDRINLVFMGMGEPFLNYDEFMAAVRLLVTEVGIAESRMTVSTSGIVPGILRFGAEKIRPKLAISLNASNDEVRERIMPVTRKWDIGDVLDAVRQVPLRPKERVTFEYVLLGGVNDRLEHADEVARLLRRANLPSKVNLIVWNPGPGIDFYKPEAGDVAAFQRRLMGEGIPAFIRKPRGLDIFAACGQLKRTVD
jgi:23S rRNA (adenine2503-C2)-methyltransferase